MTDKPETSPSNINSLYQDRFKFVLDMDRKNVEFFCARVNIPGVSMNYQTIPNPLNVTHVGGTKLQYEDLQLEFRVSEDLTNYKEIMTWMVGITAPQHTDQHKKFLEANNKMGIRTNYGIFNDATLFSLTNSSNPNIKIFFKDCFPYALSGLNMDIESKNTMTATVGFRYNYYVIDPQ